MAAAAQQTSTSAPARKQSYFAIFKKAASNWMEDNVPRLAAALAFYTLLSMAPLLVISVKVIAVFFGKDIASHQVQEQLNNLVGSVGQQAITDMIQKASQPGAGVLATIISFVILASSATGVFVELQDSMNIIWEVRPKPHQGVWGFIRNRLLSLAMVFSIAFILMVSLFISSVITGVTKHVAPGVAAVSTVLDIVLSFAVITFLFAMIFKVLPDAKIMWRNVWVGAVVTGILFILGKFGLALYFKFGSTTSAYGAAGSLAALIIWIYYSAQLVFLARSLPGSMPRQPDIASNRTSTRSQCRNRSGSPRVSPIRK